MRVRIAAVAVCAAALLVGAMPGAGADQVTTTTSSGRKILCGGVRSLDVGFCIENPINP